MEHTVFNQKSMVLFPLEMRMTSMIMSVMGLRSEVDTTSTLLIKQMSVIRAATCHILMEVLVLLTGALRETLVFWLRNMKFMPFRLGNFSKGKCDKRCSHE